MSDKKIMKSGLAVITVAAMLLISFCIVFKITTEAYAASHPQHDLTAVLGTMRYFANNTEAISQMNQGMVDVTNLGESLIGLTAEQATAIQSLPSDLATTLVAAASATALAYNVARDFNKKVQRSKSQHNEVTEMVNELNSSDENEVSRKK